MVPVSEKVLKLDEHLRCDVQLIDGGIDGIQVAWHERSTVVTVTVSHHEEDSVPNVKDFPIGSTKSLAQN